jgi:hypothetical protein
MKLSLLIIVISSLVVLNCKAQEYKIYVSPNGNDGANGEISNPIASLNHAQELARIKAGKAPVTIYLSGGNYYLTESLKLDINDSGTADTPIKWMAVPGEKPVISGGIRIKNWIEEKEGLWSASLPKNVNKIFQSFYVNDRRAVRARFPDNNYLRINKTGADRRTNFFFNKDDIPRVTDVSKIELVFLHDWSITRIGVKSIDWESNNLIAVDSIGSRLPFFKIDGWEKHPRYYLENAIEFCDSPGEWFCDFDKRKIYYCPLPNEKIDKVEGIVPIAEKLIAITGTKEKRAGFISFDGITFEYTNWQIPKSGYCGVQAAMYNDRGKNKEGWHQVPAAIELDLAENCQFKNITLKHTGGSGIWIRENSSKCVISNSHIYDIAGNGVNIGEGSKRLVNGEAWWKSAPNEVSKNNRISNSLIEDCGKQFYGAVGIWGGLIEGTIIEQNEIRNLPYTGISIGWMWNPNPTPCRENIINANHIYNVMNILSDGGGIYCLGLQPKSQITNNLIHDVKVNAGRAESNGMFLDEGIKNLLVENNILYNIARSPIRFHKAFENIVRHNVLVCGDDIPPIRYNSTKEDDIKKIENIVLRQSVKEDMNKLKDIIKNRIDNIGVKN